MNSTSADPQELRRVIQTLKQEGPLSHEQLAEKLGYDWAEMQRIVRELRNQGAVTITLDRRYEAEGDSGQIVA